ncbi:MAG: alpha/beta hydrolase [Saprospiraceae bacterium]|nr:alpha/beta hydrolase [Saprospiraceae bacterium]
MEIQNKDIQIGAYTYSVKIAGDEQAEEAVLLLHGWPETSHMWKPVLKYLATNGYYCIAPDMRGFSSHARPKGKQNYQLDHLIEDVVRFVDYFKLKHFHIIGHDWGSVVAWSTVLKYPDLAKSLVAMSVPHPKAFAEAIAQDKDQQKRSTYVKFFQWPFFPEMSLKKGNFSVLRQKCWNHSSTEQLKHYTERFAEKGCLTATLNYYRANYKMLRTGELAVDDFNTYLPTLVIKGKDDMAIGQACVENTKQYMKGDYELLLLDAGHWLVQEAENEVNKAILDHLNKYSFK